MIRGAHWAWAAHFGIFCTFRKMMQNNIGIGTSFIAFGKCASKPGERGTPPPVLRRVSQACVGMERQGFTGMCWHGDTGVHQACVGMETQGFTRHVSAWRTQGFTGILHIMMYDGGDLLSYHIIIYIISI